MKNFLNTFHWDLARWSPLLAAPLFCGFLSLSAARGDYADAVLADRPFGYWRFNEEDGPTAVNAGTEGTALDGTYIDAGRTAVGNFTLVDGREVTALGADNRALLLEDLDQYMTVEESILSALPEFTMTGWVNPGPRFENRIGLFGQNDAVEFGFINPDQIQLWTPSGQVLNYAIDPVNEIPEDTWFHLGAVGTGAELELYINGERAATTATGPGYGQSNFPFNIAGGGVYDAAGNQFTGAVDEVGAWTVALTEEQIQAHVAAGKAANGNYAAAALADDPVGYWTFDETTGTTAQNLGVSGDTLDGEYIDGERLAPGVREAFAGFPADNQAFVVEAPDDGYVTVDEPFLSNQRAFTLSGWIRPGFIVDNRVGLFGQNDAMEFGFISPTTIQMWTPNGGALNFEVFDEVVEDEWVHIAAVGDGDEIRLYIDGEEVAVGGTPIAAAPEPVDSYGDSDFFFNVGGGGIYDATGNQFTGQIDELAVWDIALTPNQIRDHFEAALGGGLLGDFNGNDQLDAGDLDLLTGGMQSGDLSFDLTGDGSVDLDDRLNWVNELRGTYIGDSNLDGEFNSSDFVLVFQAGQFESGADATWAQGDWNGDTKFTSGDFVLAFQEGGFEQGPRPAVAAVPEPAGIATLLGGLICLIGSLRKTRNR